MSSEHHPQQAAPERKAPDPEPEAERYVRAVEAGATEVFIRRLVSPGNLAHPTARALRRMEVRGAQAALGNRRVARALAQRQDQVESPGDPAPQAAPAGGLIVDDDAEPAPHQLRKSELLQQLRATAAAASAEVLGGTPWEAEAAPEIDRQLAGYASLDPAALERTLREQLAGGEVGTAADFLPLAAERVRASLREQLPPVSTAGDIDSIVAAAATAGGVISGAAQAVSGAIGAIGGGLAAFGRALFKRRRGVSMGDALPPVLRAELGEGEPLGGAAGIGRALGHDFSRVRVHTTGRAAGMVGRLGARALTVGEDVAFAEGEYRPGTPIGDALIAHELAHVAQQAGAGAVGAQRSGEGATGALEDEADAAAIGAVVAVHGGGRAEAAHLGQPMLPRLKSGLRLQLKSCFSATKTVTLLETFRKDFPTAADLIDKSPAALKLVAEGEAAGATYGGFAEDGSLKVPHPYTIAKVVYVPRARTDPVTAMNGFLFELNNAIREPQFTKNEEQAEAGKITPKQYARRKVELEVEGMLRLGEAWVEMKRAHGGTDWDKYDDDFYRQEYADFTAGKKTKDKIVDEVLQWKNGADPTKTNEQWYMDQVTKK